MKGLMFTEFVEWVESRWSLDVTDRILSAPGLSAGGAYTSVGTYPHGEFLVLATALSNTVEEPVPALVTAFGRDLFPRLMQAHPRIATSQTNVFALLERLDDHIHPEVRKLYPAAEVPAFDAEHTGADLLLTYRSARPFSALARGLIEGCVAWFDEELTIEQRDHVDRTEFLIRRVNAH